MASFTQRVTVDIVTTVTVEIEVSLDAPGDADGRYDLQNTHEILEDVDDTIALCGFCGEEAEDCPFGGGHGCASHENRAPVRDLDLEDAPNLSIANLTAHTHPLASLQDALKDSVKQAQRRMREQEQGYGRTLPNLYGGRFTDRLPGEDHR